MRKRILSFCLALVAGVAFTMSSAGSDCEICLRSGPYASACVSEPLSNRAACSTNGFGNCSYAACCEPIVYLNDGGSTKERGKPGGSSSFCLTLSL